MAFWERFWTKPKTVPKREVPGTCRTGIALYEAKKWDDNPSICPRSVCYVAPIFFRKKAAHDMDSDLGRLYYGASTFSSHMYGNCTNSGLYGRPCQSNDLKMSASDDLASICRYIYQWPNSVHQRNHRFDQDWYSHHQFFWDTNFEPQKFWIWILWLWLPRPWQSSNMSSLCTKNCRLCMFCLHQQSNCQGTPQSSKVAWGPQNGPQKMTGDVKW